MSKDKGHIESLNEKLYSRTHYKEPEDMREPISPIESTEARSGWNSGSLDDLISQERNSVEEHPILRKIFIISILFFICATAAAALVYFNGNNFISTRNLDISINAPTTIAAASVVDIEIGILNKNNAALNQVSLDITYPTGTRESENSTAVLSEESEEIDSIPAGGKVTRNKKAVFLGSAGEVKNVRITATYKVAGSNATFTKEKTFDLTIGQAPVVVSVTRPEFVTSGEPFTSTISIVSNTKDPLRGVVLRAEYPYGFSLSNSNPSTSNIGKNEWQIGTIAPGEKKTITLNGVILGEDNDERTIRFFVESGQGTGETLLSSDSILLSIKRPAIDVSIRLNGEVGGEYIAPSGRRIQGSITIKNNLPENLISPRVEAKLSGTALDKLSISAQNGGFYNSSQNSINWNNSNSESLGSIAPGETRTFTFDFSSLSNLLPGSSNQKIDLNVSLTGRPQNASSDVRISESRTIKIASEVSLSTKSLFSRGPFKNSGPIPPKAEEETTYTIALTLGNTQNEIKDGRVMATLGANVSWLGQVYGEGVNITYDEVSRIMTWHLDTLESGAGFSSPAREAYVQLSLTPSLGQVGGTPVLLNNISFVGNDSFTNTEVKVTNQAVTTMTLQDPNYVQGDEIVVK